MNSGPQRTPPRFVPTLTTVLEPSMPAGESLLTEPAVVPDADAPIVGEPSIMAKAQSEFEPVPDSPLHAEPMSAAALAARAMPATWPAPIDPSLAVALSPEAQLSEAEAFRLEEQLLHRVLQRVDFSLEERLSDAVAAAVQQHLDTMIPALRAEIEDVLRSLVSEALSRELSENPGSVPAIGPRSLG